MDPLRRPLKIPPNYPIYAEKHDINSLFANMLENILVHQPLDPLIFLLNHLKRELVNPFDVKVAVVGAPGVGKSTVVDHLVKTTGGVKICGDSWDEIKLNLETDAVRQNGYIIDGFPKTRKDCIQLQENGYLLNNLIMLTGPNDMLLRRQEGKKMDPKTHKCYSPGMAWTDDPEILERLVDVDTSNFNELNKQYTRYKQDILAAYNSVAQKLCSDQPLVDVCGRAFQIMSQRPSNTAKRTARAILVGPPGCGKRLIANRLAKKWEMLPVDVTSAINKEMLTESRIGEQMRKMKNEGQIPNKLILILLGGILESRRAALHGWIVFNFPQENGETLVSDFAKSSYTPNRIILFNLVLESVLERLSNRIIDPKDGSTYHIIYNPPTDKAVLGRCVKRESDSVENISNRYDLFEMEVDAYRSLIGEYGGFQINADQDPDTIFELVESKLDKPLPLKF